MDNYPDPRIEGWNAAIDAAAEVYANGFPAWDVFGNATRAIRAIPCPYTPKEGKDDDQ